MQLGIKASKTKFLECSNHFNHYIYELKRSQFGPISELSNIWINGDDRGKFYLDKMEELSDLQAAKQKEGLNSCCSIQANHKKNMYPFLCSHCK